MVGCVRTVGIANPECFDFDLDSGVGVFSFNKTVHFTTMTVIRLTSNDVSV
jgi:hypothetical protein